MSIELGAKSNKNVVQQKDQRITYILTRPCMIKVEINDKFEHFIEYVMREEKEIILMGVVNKVLFNEAIRTEWINFTTFLGLGQ